MSSNTSSYSSHELLSICKTVHELKDPIMATSTSLASSRLAIVTSILSCPLAAFLNVLVLLSFYKNSSLRKKANVFLCSMAIVDMTRSLLSFSLFLTTEVVYQQRLKPNCFVTVFLVTIDLSVVGELILSSMNCERFIALKYPIWHQVHLTKRRLIKATIESFVTGVGASQIRIFKEAGRTLNFLVFSCSWFCTLVFSILIWWTIKKRNQRATVLSYAQNCLVEQSQQNPNGSEKVALGNDEGRQTNKSCQINFQSMIQRGETSGFGIINSQYDEISPQYRNDWRSAEQNEVSKLSTAERGQADQRQSDFSNSVSKDASGVTEGLQREKEKQQNAHLWTLAEKTNAEKHSKKRDSKSQITPQVKTSVHPQVNSIANVMLVKSEKKAAKIATYLAISLVPTRIIPTFVFLSLSRKFSVMYVAAPWLPTLTLLISLVNPVIYIGANQDIRQTCIRLIKCNNI